jgi:N-formylglutamate deformylase
MRFNLKDLNFPIIAAAVHDGHEIRDNLKKFLALNESGRLREEDPFTSKWLSIAKNTITTKVSRFEVDLNRPRDKAVYLTPEDSWGLRVWNQDLPEEQYNYSIQLYDKFYKKLEGALNKMRRFSRYIVIYDLHSYNYKRNGPDNPPEEDRLNPEINLGTGTMNREKWAPIVDRFLSDIKSYDFLGRKLDIRENIKFKGGYFPRWIHQNFPENVCCLSIEFRKFFMDEWTGKPNLEVINEIKKVLKNTTDGVLEEISKFK